MALFENYLESKWTYVKSISKWLAASVVTHILIVVGIVALPLINIEQLPAPPFVIGVFEATPPPPPPPPPPPGGAEEKPKEEEKKPKEKDVLKEVEKVPLEVKKTEAPPNAGGVVGGVEGGVAGGVVGGVVGGTVGGLPGKMLFEAQRKVSGDDPSFPPEARALGLSAKVAARICISESGSVTSIKILRGVDQFNQAVEKAVKGWRYEPYSANGIAVPACFPVFFNFNLQR